ncbi:MAG: AAC(3) family N-acetyltransferase [Eubacteriales bacterium]|nr:AAC(3) family N-acetyltransferase [Eubacteriales bacterium]
MQSILTRKDLAKMLAQAGVEAGQQVMVHTSLKSLGYVVGGAQAVIEALQDVLGPQGTMMMPTQSWKNLDPEVGVHGDVPREWWPIIRENYPAYDKRITPTSTMGAVAEMLRTWPGAVRSDHPARSVTALGKNAAYLAAGHDTLENIFGEGSPIARLYELDGAVLLLGVGYNKNTSLHLADARAEYPGKHLSTDHSAVLVNGVRQWVAYDTLYVDGEDFLDIGAAFEATGAVKVTRIGDAEVRWMKQRALVDFAVEWMEKNRK